MAARPSTLVIFAHPVLERARVGPGLLAAAEGTPGVEVRDLYELYPDFTIDVDVEQEALLRHQRLVLQFPLFWYSAPALLKEWLDQVLTHGFAYGEEGLALKGKTLACAVTAGGGSAPHQTHGHDHASIEALLRPFHQTAHLCHMQWLAPFIVRGDEVRTPQDLAREALRYGDYLRGRK
jgi:glutathione-regulated potassium-efflux system ancillary protein KefG